MPTIRITVMGLGYVGLPLANLLAQKYSVVGFDIDSKRVAALKKCTDTTLEVSKESLERTAKNTLDDSLGLCCTDFLQDIAHCDYYIITVPTPVDSSKKPVLTPLLRASEMVGRFLKKGATVIYESTVYPGVTQEECVPVLQRVSGLVFNKDFFVGYSPERTNPGDKKNKVEQILKITSGSNKATAQRVDDLYKSIIKAGTYKAPSIRIAEAAKVIENAQRDMNIAFVNELAKIFNLLKIDTREVLKAAATKWNFLPFTPGLVGGHCIGVDPYYLARKAQKIGYNPELILTARRINDSMGFYVAERVLKLMIQKDIPIKSAALLVLGLAFKENCADFRNTKVADIVQKLKEFVPNITLYDPWVSPCEVQKAYGWEVQKTLENKTYDVIVLAVAHETFKHLNFKKLRKTKSVLYDVKSFLDKEQIDMNL